MQELTDFRLYRRISDVEVEIEFIKKDLVELKELLKKILETK